MVLAGIGFERVFQGATHGCLDPAYLLVPVEPLREKEEALHGQGIELFHGPCRRALDLHEAEMVKDEKDIGREAEELLAGREGWLISKVVDGASSLVQKGARLCVSRDPRWLPEVDRLGQSFQTVLAEGLANAPWIETNRFPARAPQNGAGMSRRRFSSGPKGSLQKTLFA